MVRVGKDIGKGLQRLLWGSNEVCTKPNRSYGFSTPLVGCLQYAEPDQLQWGTGSHWSGLDSGDDPLPPTPFGYTCGYFPQFFPHFF